MTTMNANDAVNRITVIQRAILELVTEAESIMRDLPIRYGTDIANNADDWIMNIRIHATDKHGYSNIRAAETIDDTIARLRRYVRAGE